MISGLFVPASTPSAKGVGSERNSIAYCWKEVATAGWCMPSMWCKASYRSCNVGGQEVVCHLLPLSYTSRIALCSKEAFPMKRTPLQRKSKLESGGLLKKTKLRPIGKRVLREMEARRNFTRVVLARAKGRCERCKEPQGHWTLLQAHHIRAKSQGGSHDPKTNGKAVCRRCHRVIHERITDEHGYGGDWLWSRKKDATQ